MTTPIPVISLRELADRIAYLVTTLNGLVSQIVNEEVSTLDFDDDLTALVDRLHQVELAVNNLVDVSFIANTSKERSMSKWRG